MGNQTSDGRKGLQFSYNILNLPCGVTSATSGSLTYTYLSDGTKVSAVKSDGSGKRYVGSMVYSVPESGSGSEVFESASWDEGRIFFDVEVPVDSTGNGLVVVDSIPGIGCYRDCWYVTDHIGNVRSVVDISSSLASPLVVERNDYLPYGTRVGVGNAVLESNRYRLGGKEEQVFGGLDLGKVDFGARMYDPFTARWTTQDPMAAKYAGMSPYGYCAGNPVNLVDPDGRVIVLPKGTSQRDLHTVLGNLQRLTNDKLVYSTQNDGTIRVLIASLGTGNKTAGTRLLRRINSSKKTMTIRVANPGHGNTEQDLSKENSTNGKGTDVDVFFDPTSNPDILTVNPKTGCVSGQKRPHQVGLAHELIHGERSMRGEAIDYNEWGTYTYKDDSNQMVTASVRKEEAATVGIKYHSAKDITENQIREEQGVSKRGAY